MGGRVAEELVLKMKTTGAGNDIERASDLARKMVCDYGEYDEVLEELNDDHEKVEEFVWAYLSEGDSIHVTLVRQEWYFTVREARKK